MDDTRQSIAQLLRPRIAAYIPRGTPRHLCAVPILWIREMLFPVIPQRENVLRRMIATAIRGRQVLATIRIAIVIVLNMTVRKVVQQLVGVLLSTRGQ